MIIALKGKAGHGKDTVANIIKELDSSFKSKAFAAKLKLIAHHLTSIPLEKFETNKDEHIQSMDMSIREFLQKLGTTIRTVKDDIFIKALLSEMIIGENYVITDVRFKSELEIIKHLRILNLDKVIILKVVRPEYIHSSIVNETKSHSSEIELDDDTSEDFVITNDGTLEDLKTKVSIIMSKLKETRNES